MRLLVLGGGGFLGWHFACEGRAAGHDVTVFGRSDPGLGDGIEVLRGDRTDDLSALDGRAFDAVLDTLSDVDAVGETARRFADVPYGYVSGMSVYHPCGPAIPDESAPLRVEGDPWCDDVLQARSLDKLACEGAVRDAVDVGLVLRVGIMVGPRDPTDRFTWWPVRLARAAAAGERAIVAPGDPRRPVQLTDARDVAAFAVRSLAAGTGGTFNLVGSSAPVTCAEALDACRTAAGAEDVELAWTGEALLRRVVEGEDGARRALGGDRGIAEDEARPLWFPEDQIPQAAIDSSAAVAAGFTTRPVLETARDVLAWRQAQDEPLQAGMDPGVEAAILRVRR